MNADSAFIKGATHAVCQDYAVTGDGLPIQPAAETNSQVAPYVILSDGCSSSPDTDIGARLLVKAAEQVLLTSGQPSASDLAAMHKEAARRALVLAELTGVSPQAVDATLLTVHLRGDELITGCSGDGVIVLQSRADVLDIYTISYASGYPLYPSYAHQPERLLALEQDGGTKKEVKHFRCASVEEPARLVDTSSGASLTEVLAVKASDYKLAVILSDGIHSFFTIRQRETGRRVEAITMEETLRELISFKSLHGAFVGRRVKRFIKDYLTRGWQQTDDLAVGALHLGD